MKTTIYGITISGIAWAGGGDEGRDAMGEREKPVP